jgi:uncharacterized protein (DUF488 family)
MTQTVYTIGYAGKSADDVKRIAEELYATVFDVRFSPRSRNPQFSGRRLAQLLGGRYVHVRAFGNRNYKDGPIEIVDYEAGRALVEGHPRPVILMCVCRDPGRCHRTAVGRQLVEDGFRVVGPGPTAVAVTHMEVYHVENSMGR